MYGSAVPKNLGVGVNFRPSVVRVSKQANNQSKFENQPIRKLYFEVWINFLCCWHDKKENSKQDTFLEEVWKLKCDFINTFIILWSVHDDAEISQKKMDY